MRIATGLILSLVWMALAPVPLARGENVLTNEWTVAIHSGSDSAPAVGTDGTIYFGTWIGELWALNPDGTRKWVFAAHNEIRSGPAVGLDGTVYFGSRDWKFYAIGADGRKRWEFPTGGWVDSSPALAHDGTVYFGSWDRNLYALNTDGKERWRFSTAGVITSSPAIGTDGTIYFGSHDGKFYALAPDGHKKWEFTTGGAILSSPALNEDVCLYFTSVDGCLYALNLDGSLRWRLRTGGTTESSPVIGEDGTIYVGVEAHPWAISPDGKKKWGRSGDEEWPFEASPVALAGGEILCATHYPVLEYVNAEGRERLSYRVQYYGYGSPAVGPTGTIYVPDASLIGGGFSALRANAQLAHSPWPKFRGDPRNTGNILDAAR